jgi:hypothetical protein
MALVGLERDLSAPAVGRSDPGRPPADDGS